MNELRTMIEECDELIEEMDWLEDITKEWHKFFESTIEWESVPELCGVM